MTTAPTELKPSAPAVGGVRVKPLKWTESNSRAFSGSFGGRVEYVIQHGTKHFRLYFRSNDEYLGSFDTLEAAKAAAQAHHEAAILSALEPQAADDAMVERAENAAFTEAYNALSGADHDEVKTAISRALSAYRAALQAAKEPSHD